MSLSRTAIEYGHVGWPLVTGCSHGPQECAVADKCWARHIYATRFHRDFTPTLHPERLYAPLPRKPSRILVSFTGDMFADQWAHNAEWQSLIGAMRTRMANYPQHSFLLLTKRSQNYTLPGSWPSNAWLGASITGAESLQVQGQRVGALCDVQDGRHSQIWLSYEPIMGPLTSLAGASWLVCGGFSGRKRLTPEQKGWARDALDWADRLGVPVWAKVNCGQPGWPQEFPKGMVR